MKYCNESVFAVVCALSLGVAASDYTWTGAGSETDGNYDSPFENPTNYAENSGHPGTDDVIVIPANTDLEITTGAQLDWIARLARIKPAAESSRLVVTVPQNEVWTNACPMTSVNLDAPGGSAFANGVMVKRGKGDLLLRSGEKFPAKNSATTIYDFWTGFEICEGTLSLPQDAYSPNYYLGYMTISNGATFHTTERNAAGVTAKTSCTTYVRGLFGGGDVTNSDARTLTIMPSSTQRVTEFGGRFLGDLYITIYNGGTVNLTDTNSVNTCYLNIQQGTAGVQSIGKTGQPSSIGTYSTLYFHKQLARLVYLGDGEETDKSFYVHQTLNNPAYIDGGVNGGLVLRGDIRPSDAKGTPRTVVFTGSNVTECAIDCTLYGGYESTTHVKYEHLNYAKEGSGTWLATHHTGRNMPGLWSVREGTLKYASLDEAGYISSLGTATNMTASGTNDKVDYAFCLGSSTTPAATPVLEYVGTNEYSVATRPAVLAGDATFRNSSEKAIRFAGVSALTAGLKTLTLDGDGGVAQTNEMADVSDGIGQIGVTKTGSATWVLGGDQTFTGPIDVQEGTLVVRKTDKTRYDWFRWTITGLHTNANGSTDYANINAFALLDANGAWQNVNLSYVTNDVATMPPGSCAYQTAWSVSNGVAATKNDGTPLYNGELNRMFAKSDDYGTYMIPLLGKSIYRPVEGDKRTWTKVVMHLADNANEVTSFDVMPVWGTGQKRKAVKSYILEGSVDGLHWEQIATEDDMPVGSASWTWAYANTTKYTDTHTGGKTVDRGSSTRTWHVLEGGNTVSVAPGAKIVADGDITLSSVRLAATGGGTIDGFSFALEGGTLEVTGWSDSYAEIPLNLANATGLENVSGWSLSLNGKSTRRRFTVTETGITIKPLGVVLSIR
jgi:autotransporter-associated beta strand protein